MGNIIIIASGKGGTGKTTLTSHLGAALASMGKLTAVVDADAGFRNLDIALGLESSIVYDYSDFMYAAFWRFVLYILGQQESVQEDETPHGTYAQFDETGI